LTIVLGQIGKVTGLTIEAGGIAPRLLEVVQKLPLVHWPTVAVAVGAFVVLVLAPRPFPRVPAALLALIASGAAVALLGLDRIGVAVVGKVPSGLPPLRLPVFPIDKLGLLMAEAAAVALVSFTSGIVTTRAFASKNHYDIDVDREFAALGAAQIAASLSQAFPVAGADSRTAANDAAGGRTQVTGLVAAAAIALVLMFFTGPIRYAPTAALGAVLVRSAISLVDVRAFREILRIDRGEFLLAFLTMLGVVWFGAIDAVLLAVLLALLRFVRVAARPDVALLGMQAGVRGIHDLRSYPDAKAPSGLMLVRFDGPLAFFNATYLKERVLAAASAAGPGLRAVIIDATAFSMRMDSTAVTMLVELRDDLALRGVGLALAGKRTLIEQWRRERGFATERVGDEPGLQLFSTMEDAVDAFANATRGAEARSRQR